jgi:hypothetical protein
VQAGERAAEIGASTRAHLCVRRMELQIEPPRFKEANKPCVETQEKEMKDARDSSLGRVLLQQSVRFVQARVAISKE